MKATAPGFSADKQPPPPSVPKGCKINEILPVYSPALSGGGISDNLMKDLMRDEGLGMADTGSVKKKSKRR
jgi:signal recognition particle subunit SRP19